MKMLNKYFDMFFLKQWVVGVARCDIRELIRNKENALSFKWFEPAAKNRFFADPFIFINGKEHIHLIYEDIVKEEGYGKLSLMVLDSSMKLLSQKVVLDTKIHLSYPFVFQDEDKFYIFPENSRGGGLVCYEFETKRQELINRKKISDLPVIDPTILHYQDKYWLFGTMPGKESNTALHIFYADSLFGPYKAHKLNPVARNSDGVRPAGGFICADGVVYRPSQVCKNSYGESIAINKLCLLNENEFAEEKYMDFKPEGALRSYFGLHTINSAGDFIVVDVLKRHFQPFQQTVRWVKKQIKKPESAMVTTRS